MSVENTDSKIRLTVTDYEKGKSRGTPVRIVNGSLGRDGNDTLVRVDGALDIPLKMLYNGS